uniref:Uncharacterized protein n=1 Tax=viral metagenome TaxID=1070528 RepID=A0A6C0H856_9ZZZZ
MTTRHVTFNLEQNTVHETYSRYEYNRHSIDSILYLKCYNRISQQEWCEMLEKLERYKFHEMLVHKDSVISVRLR